MVAICPLNKGRTEIFILEYYNRNFIAGQDIPDMPLANQKDDHDQHQDGNNLGCKLRIGPQLLAFYRNLLNLKLLFKNQKN
jgi:hypothetical protein